MLCSTWNYYMKKVILRKCSCSYCKKKREHFLIADPGAAHVTSREGRQRSPTPTEMFGLRLGRFNCTAAGVVYVITCQLALLQVVHRRNWSKACVSFRGTPAFSGGFQTEPSLPGGWVPRGRTIKSTWTQPSPWHANVCGRRNGNTTARRKTSHFPAWYTRPQGLEHWF